MNEPPRKSTTPPPAGTISVPRPPEASIEATFREEYAAVFASLLRATRDFDAAEEALQQAFTAAVEAWPRDGVPARPGAWIVTAARNAAASAARHRAMAARKHVELAIQDAAEDDEDDRLRLIFTCCHPALSPETSIALALRTVCGVPTPAVARLLLAPEATIAQRLVRAKHKIREARIPFRVPDDEHVDERLANVLSVVYLLFTAGYSPSSGDRVVNVELCAEAVRLGRLVAQLLPARAEVRGLLALMLLHHARHAARVDAAGEIVPLEDQDRARWDHAAIAEGRRLLDEALARRAPGPFQIQAAIAALHAGAPSAAATDWAQIAALYEELWRREPSPAVALNLAIAMGMALGPEAGLARIDAGVAAGVLRGFDRVSLARADLLRRAGRHPEAVAAYRDALACARTPREQRLIERRLAECDAREATSGVPPLAARRPDRHGGR